MCSPVINILCILTNVIYIFDYLVNNIKIIIIMYWGKKIVMAMADITPVYTLYPRGVSRTCKSPRRAPFAQATPLGFRKDFTYRIRIPIYIHEDTICTPPRMSLIYRLRFLFRIRFECGSQWLMLAHACFPCSKILLFTRGSGTEVYTAWYKTTTTLKFYNKTAHVYYILLRVIMSII